jgi:hypothetical protein
MSASADNNQRRQIRQGFVFVEGEVLKALDEPILTLMKSTFAIVTHDIKVKDLFMDIISKARASAEADEDKGGKWN